MPEPPILLTHQDEGPWWLRLDEELRRGDVFEYQAVLGLFSDWLEDRGDQRAVGVRTQATAPTRVYPMRGESGRVLWLDGGPRHPGYSYHLPAEVFAWLRHGVAAETYPFSGNVYRTYPRLSDAVSDLAEAPAVVAFLPARVVPKRPTIGADDLTAR